MHLVHTWTHQVLYQFQHQLPVSSQSSPAAWKNIKIVTNSAAGDKMYRTEPMRTKWKQRNNPSQMWDKIHVRVQCEASKVVRRRKSLVTSCYSQYLLGYAVLHWVEWWSENKNITLGFLQGLLFAEAHYRERWNAIEHNRVPCDYRRDGKGDKA